MAEHEIPRSIYRQDGSYVNLLNRYGTSQDSSTAWRWNSGDRVPDIVLTEQYEGNGLFAKIIDIPAEEAVKHGFDLGICDRDTEALITGKLDYLDWDEKAATALKWARLYGGALGVMLIDDGRGIEQPVNWNRINGIEEIRVYDRSLVWPDYGMMQGQGTTKPGRRGGIHGHGEPEYYYISSLSGQFWVHSSRCLVFRGGVLPERTTQSDYLFWGVPEYVRIRRELREAATSHSMGVKMLERSVQAVYSMSGLSGMLAAEDGMDTLLKRMAAVDMSRGILSSIVIDGEGESYDFKTFPMAGVRDVIDSTCNMLSAVTSIPQTILFGRDPAGMNSTGKGDLENWYSYVERIQKLSLRRNMQKVIDLIIRAGMNTGKLAEKPEYELKFSPLWSATAEDEAKTNQIKAQTAQIRAQTAKTYFEMGVLDPAEIREWLAKDGEFEGLIEQPKGLTDLDWDGRIKDNVDADDQPREPAGSPEGGRFASGKGVIRTPSQTITEVHDPTTGERLKVVQGAPVGNPYNMAGTPGKPPVKQADRLSQEYGGDAEGWRKRAQGMILDDNGGQRQGQVHSFFHKDVGYVEQKLKRWR